MRKKFDKELYEDGLVAEKFILDQVDQNLKDFGLDSSRHVVIKNSDKYGVDILILEKQPNKLYKEVLGIEVMRRQSVDHQNIFVESNKERFNQDSIPVIFIIVQRDLKKALVLRGAKSELSQYSKSTTNYNSEGTDELNYFVPRDNFEEWDFVS